MNTAVAEKGASMPIYFETSRWPLVVARHVGKPSPEETDQMFRHWEDVLARGEKYASITDLTEAEIGSMADQKRSLEWMKANESRIAQLCVASATVVTSPAMRSLLKTVFFLKRPQYPMEIAANLGEAEAFVQQRLREAGLDDISGS